jgi:hypothetical protein
MGNISGTYRHQGNTLAVLPRLMRIGRSLMSFLFFFHPFLDSSIGRGSMTIQGLLAYYYTEIQHDTSVELNRCRFNQIAENPRRSSFAPVGIYPRGTAIDPNSTKYYDRECRDGRDECEDVQCQTYPL